MSEGRQQINCPPSCPGKVCFVFTDGCTSRCHHASCAKQHPANNCPYQRVLIPISVPRQWELGTKFPSGDQTACFPKAELLPYCSQQCQAAAMGGLSRLYLHRGFLYLPRNPPLLQTCGAGQPWEGARPAALPLLPGTGTAGGLEVQAQTATTEPSARIQSTTGAITGFR